MSEEVEHIREIVKSLKQIIEAEIKIGDQVKRERDVESMLD